MCVHVSEVGSAGQGLPPGEKATGDCKLPLQEKYVILNTELSTYPFIGILEQ